MKEAFLIRIEQTSPKPSTRSPTCRFSPEHQHRTISRGEIGTALAQLKNAKAPGVDDIPPEALKEGGPCTVEALHSILNFVWEKEVIPDDWKRGLLVKLTKKGDLERRRLCGNWRGIMFLSISSKVLTRVILNRMKVAVDEALRDEQAGFRKDRSCIDHIATLRIIVEQTIEWSSPCTCYSWILRRPLILWIGRLCGGFFIIMVYLIKSSTCLRFSIRALLAKCFMEEL